MAISDKARKILWGRSGNRCAICQLPLVVGPTAEDTESVVGEECHIVSAKPEGPRFDAGFPVGSHDHESNLLLLCAVHHKQVDDQSRGFPAERLRAIKRTHEQRVASSLDSAREEPVRIRRKKPDELLRLNRITTGNELLGIIANACESSLEHAELAEEWEVEEVSAFFQCAQDTGEMFSELEPGARVRAAFDLTKQIRTLEASGLLVFGLRVEDILEGGTKGPAPWPVAFVRIARGSDPQLRCGP